MSEQKQDWTLRSVVVSLRVFAVIFLLTIATSLPMGLIWVYGYYIEPSVQHKQNLVELERQAELNKVKHGDTD